LPVPVQFTMLGSGSSGNSAYLEAGSTRLLIDAGLSGRQVRQRLLSLGRAPEGLDGILITHEHTDHTQGLVVLAAKLQIPVYCNRLTREAIESSLCIKCQFHLFETGATFEVGETVVETFGVPHDAFDPVGFLIRTAAGNLGFLTDLGHATKLVIQRARPANVLVIETNHDVEMLQNDTRRPWSLKQRILSRHGHLSNEAAANALEEIVSAGLRHVFLAHLSRDCNKPELAQAVVSERLDRLGASHVHLETTQQAIPSRTLVLEELAGKEVEMACSVAAPLGSDPVSLPHQEMALPEPNIAH
jgi:phosphoribosyl 1,2-cyclic phosphodiesterase